MKKAMRIDMVERAFELLDNNDTTRVDDIYLSPVASYTCTDWLALEEDILFKNYPLLAAFSCDLPKAGDFITNDDTGVPMLLVRDKDGGINASITPVDTEVPNWQTVAAALNRGLPAPTMPGRMISLAILPFCPIRLVSPVLIKPNTVW